MLSRVDIQEIVERHLGAYDLAAPTLDPRFRLVEELWEAVEDEPEKGCPSCGCLVDRCEACVEMDMAETTRELQRQIERLEAELLLA